MTMAQPNKPMTAYGLLELARQPAVTPTYVRGLWGLPQQEREANGAFAGGGVGLL